MATKSSNNNSTKYAMYPTAEDGVPKVTCNVVSEEEPETPDDILPYTWQFIKIGKEKVRNIDCNKYKQVEKDVNTETRETLYAFYDTGIKAWTPVRYEKITFNTWHGSIQSHAIWDFDNFETTFSSEDVFDEMETRCYKENLLTKHLEHVDPENEEHVKHVFKHFKKKYNIVYAHKKEKKLRKEIFKKNLRLITSTNRKNLGYKLTVNKFSDKTPEEMRRSMGLLKRPEGAVGTDAFPYKENEIDDLADHLPREYDLRELGVIAPVQNQETCGSCWTFGTTAAVEGAVARSNGGNVIRLANQALIDCSWDYDNAGCNGGFDTSAYHWMMDYGLPTEEEYGSYANADGFCHIHNMTKLYPIRGFVDVPRNSEKALKVALINHGPLSVSVHVNDAFSQYSGGIFYDQNCSTVELNHEITLVGYGELDGEPYWIVRNSWGTEWGIDGYMHIAIRDNNCGIMTEPTYVLI